MRDKVKKKVKEQKETKKQYLNLILNRNFIEI